VRFLPLLLLLGPWLHGASDPFFPDEYRSRRAAFRKSLPSAAIVLMGADERAQGNLRTAFAQSSNFLYLTGWREPGAALLLTPDDEVLFLPKRNDVRDRYTGRKIGPDDDGIRDRTGFESVAETGALAARITEAEKKGWSLYSLPKDPGFARLPKEVADRKWEDAANAIASLRMVKSAAEIRRIQASIDVSIDAHTAAWSRIRSGLFEYQVAATMTSVYFERGCARSAYPPIVASGPNSIVLHYSSNARRMDGGEVLLMDVGAECSDYAADLTRTVPVSGKFTARQREIYDIVLGAQKAAIAAAKPGMKLTGHGKGTLNQVALDYVNEHGKGPHGEALGKYYLHQLGHHVGLDVHDPAVPDVELTSGMVVTIEPGIYIAEENLGIRIEDVVLITSDGAKVLSDALPKDAREIEKRLSRPRK
jgi:Xaa-Pro aminopeptidase